MDKIYSKENVMKKILVILLSIITTAVLSAPIELPDNLTQKQVEDISAEFAMNLSHTAVAAPETKGLWGIEVGIVGGQTSSPELSNLIDQAGSNGNDFKKIYHGGLIGRAHIPFDIFAEATVLPEREISDVNFKNASFGLGWNAGAYFNLPLDVAIGANFSSSEIKFNQSVDVAGLPVDSDINFQAKTKVIYFGLSKEFLFITPYIKMGAASFDSDVKVDVNGGTIFASNKQSATADGSGGYYVIGANLQLLLLRIGIEASKSVDIGRVTGKLSLAF